MKFLYPVHPNSIVTQTFADHVARAKAHGWKNYNGGIDWAIPSGMQVKAAQAGEVSAVRHDATGYGVHVRVQHESGYLTIYGHLMSIQVAVGDEVKAGDVLGQSDNTGNSTGPHLHFELRHNNIAVDPQPLMVTQIVTETGVEEPTDIEEESKPRPEEFPVLPKAKVTSVALNIRMGPGVENSLVGMMPHGQVFEVLDVIDQDGDEWLHVGFQQYVAMRFGGDQFAIWV